MNPEIRTELSSLGEFGLIEHLSKHITTSRANTVKGIGDDCAVIDRGDYFELVTTDMLLEGVHFDLSYCPLKHLGYKAVVVNLSDVYAMNGLAEQITVSIGLSNRFSLEAVEELYAGMLMACEKYGVDLIGGDTSSSKSGLTISITAIGKVDKDKIVYRSGAKPKELIVVSGDLGGAYMGLQLLEREKEVFEAAPTTQPDLEGNDYVLERQLKPEARMDVIDLLKSLDVVPTSMIDISDGLASEVLHLARQSGVGANIHEDKIPIDPTTFNVARDFGLDPTVCALSGGEDYELLFTIKQEDYEKIKGNPSLTVIGYMTDENAKSYLLDKQEGLHELKAQGWDALMDKDLKGGEKE
jgi:thiamine-monophosphate kinase